MERNELGNHKFSGERESVRKFSIIVPARNEEKYIGKCLESIRAASAKYDSLVEVIVVLNRCTDATESIALEYDALVVYEDSKNLSKIRNAGARAASGKILVTIDADSRMSPNMLEQIERALSQGRYIGGGVLIRAERFSLGIFATALLAISFMPLGLSAGLFWCYREDFLALGGFSENLLVGEDVDFARRLRIYGRQKAKGFGTLCKAHIVTSCRKFDSFGDWYFVKRPLLLWHAIHGIDTGFSSKIFYDYLH